MAPIDFARFANMSLATLVLPRVFSSSDNKDFAETPPPRLFEAALAGTVQLVHSKLAETVDYLEVNKEFLFFDTVSDLESCINNLRNNFEFRYEIALMSQNKVFSSHCYEHRVRYVIDEAQKMKLRSSESKKNKLDLKVKKRIIFVVHNVVEYGNFGGVEVYLKNISQELAHIYEVFFYVPGGPGVSSGAKVLDYVGKVVSNFNFSNIISPWSVSCSEREKAFLTTLVNLKIDLVHFHHLIGHPLSLVGLAKTLGCATVITFHDYYALCHNFNLLSFKGVYCHPEDISLDQCDVCLLNMHHISPGGQAARRSYWDRLLANIDILIFNTHGVRELVSSIYPSVTSHGKKEILSVPIGGSQRPLLKNKRNLSTLKVAILGNFSTHKGGGVIARSIQIMDSSRYEFHIFGRVDSGFAWLVDKNNNPSVHVHGGYSAGELPSLLYECHVSLHLSIWPETYCLTLSEAWDCGLVPIVSDIGALGERVEDGVTGLKITPNSEGALVQALRRLAETPGLLENLKNNIIQISTPRITHHVNELDNLYQSLLSKSFSLGSYASGMNLEALTNNTPIEWANVRNVSQGARRDMYAAPSLRYRLLGLLVRGVGYYKLHGLKSTVGKIQRYIVRRF
jgi:glycosyltransferase involved in cell wall biosynthesis